MKLESKRRKYTTKELIKPLFNLHMTRFLMPSGNSTAWYLGWIPGFLGFSNWANENSIWIAWIVELQLLRGRLSRWACPGKFFIWIKLCAIKFHIFWCPRHSRDWKRKKVLQEKLLKTSILWGWNCVGWAQIKGTCSLYWPNLLEIWCFRFPWILNRSRPRK